MINDVQETQPLLNVRIELLERKIHFLPSLDFDAEDGLLKLMEHIVGNIFHIVDSVPRVFQPSEPTELRATFRGNTVRGRSQKQAAI